MHATRSALLTLFDLITLTIFGEAYKLLSFSLCSPVQLPVTSSPLGPNILPSIYVVPCVRVQVCPSVMISIPTSVDTDTNVER